MENSDIGRQCLSIGATGGTTRLALTLGQSVEAALTLLCCSKRPSSHSCPPAFSWFCFLGECGSYSAVRRKWHRDAFCGLPKL
jgi:hypothetical protein